MFAIRQLLLIDDHTPLFDSENNTHWYVLCRDDHTWKRNHSYNFSLQGFSHERTKGVSVVALRTFEHCPMGPFYGYYSTHARTRQILSIVAPGMVPDDIYNYPGIREYVARLHRVWGTGLKFSNGVHFHNGPPRPDGSYFVFQKSQHPQFPGNSYLRIGCIERFGPNFDYHSTDPRSAGD